jgi:hypothetical protein
VVKKLLKKQADFWEKSEKTTSKKQDKESNQPTATEKKNPRIGRLFYCYQK